MFMFEKVYYICGVQSNSFARVDRIQYYSSRSMLTNFKKHYVFLNKYLCNDVIQKIIS